MQSKKPSREAIEAYLAALADSRPAVAALIETFGLEAEGLEEEAAPADSLEAPAYTPQKAAQQLTLF